MKESPRKKKKMKEKFLKKRFNSCNTFSQNRMYSILLLLLLTFILYSNSPYL